jgi:hypothetical protein
MKRYDTNGADEYFTHSYLIVDLIADPNGFTVNFISLCETFLPDGEYDVQPIDSRDLPLGIGLSFTKNANGDYELTAESMIDWHIPDIQIKTEQLKGQNYINAMYHFVGAIPSSGRFAIGGGTAVVTDYADSLTPNGEFLIKFFPGAMLSIEKYDEKYTTYPPGNWIIEYSDSRKNISVGRNGMAEIQISVLPFITASRYFFTPLYALISFSCLA